MKQDFLLWKYTNVLYSMPRRNLRVVSSCHGSREQKGKEQVQASPSTTASFPARYDLPCYQTQPAIFQSKLFQYHSLQDETLSDSLNDSPVLSTMSLGDEAHQDGQVISICGWFFQTHTSGILQSPNSLVHSSFRGRYTVAS